MTTDMLNTICIVLGICLFYIVFDKILFPKLVEKSTVEIEKNPKWITSKLQYYGFGDIDFILVRSRLGNVPRFRVNKEGDRLELLLPENLSVKDVEAVGRLALVCKIKAVYGISFPDKPLYWLSILCYMLDGGDIEVKDKKPIDDF